ncbi:MAG: electron transfer flavoprotein subunit alpha/FixB family protein [Thermoplasmata archaeon]|nr:electron transfer flavoprotein subunit alpha/FixB family protein [Candidatus Sysuiplasma acidicola]MBX8645513.1 electron transfer flavoprotein subunit alpha/FixB family protein [Candidatus Sysuiplasma acidicola]MDH2904914.1 electron transfer flavoprotein subunit alpha/FixB family protein [Methanomassiliicoccales archaeon]
MAEILVVAEQREGVLKDVSLENIALARELAGESGKVAVLALGSDIKSVGEKLSLTSADTVLIADDAHLKDYTYDAYRHVLKTVAGERKPSVIIGGHTSLGMDFFPGVAIALGLPVVTDCVRAVRDGSRVTATRQLYGGKLDGEFSVEGPCIITVRPGANKPCAEGTATVSAVGIDFSSMKNRTAVRGYEKPPREDVDIEKARIVVSVGRGIEKKENLPVFEDLVNSLSGAVLAGSRPVIDNGWLPKGRQVGVSGKTVKPKLYIALGISGAIQHLSGMSGSDFIVAINKDRDAPIFKVANVGVVDDIFKVVPAMVKELHNQAQTK